MSCLDLRDKFFEFWERRGHKKIPSSSLVPENDPTTLFTGSGMQPLIPYLLGQPHPLGKRLMSIQKCFRGQDIDEVGNNRHDTFFEMYGNWSLGDYFKKDQLVWYWEFLTKTLGFDPKKLHVTCLKSDEESAKIWLSLGIAKERIYFYGEEKNWWSRSGIPANMPPGEVGGPDSEVFYEFDIPHDPKFGKNCHPNCDCGKFLEIGNSVFIQYQKQNDGSFKELPQKNVDFGGGFERTLAALNNDPDFYKTDVHRKNIAVLEKISGKKYEETKREFRIIADHVKSAVFLTAAGVTPSNTDRGYVLRRLIRRAIRFSDQLGIKKDLATAVADSNIEIYKDVYPDIMEKKNLIHEILENEEKRFRGTLTEGLKMVDKISPFDLFQSYGFPPELTEEILKQKGQSMDWDEFRKKIKEHQEKSRSGGQGKFKGGLADHSEIVTKYHTATHLLQAALRKVLGEHVHQEGSNITAERLRFDFSHDGKLTPEEIKEVEDLVNKKIKENLERKVEMLDHEEAVKSGALAFFKERYPEKVTVYSFGDFSREICGGPHAERTGVLGKFKITREEAVSSGIRRIYAILE